MNATIVKANYEFTIAYALDLMCRKFKRQNVFSKEFVQNALRVCFLIF